jgi:hypothetical protein
VAETRGHFGNPVEMEYRPLEAVTIGLIEAQQAEKALYVIVNCRLIGSMNLLLLAAASCECTINLARKANHLCRHSYTRQYEGCQGIRSEGQILRYKPWALDCSAACGPVWNHLPFIASATNHCSSALYTICISLRRFMCKF